MHIFNPEKKVGNEEKEKKILWEVEIPDVTGMCNCTCTQATACDRRRVFATNKRKYTLVETWRAISAAISKYGWNAYEWNTKMTNWLGGARATTSHFQEEEKKRNNRGKGRIWGVDFKSLLVSFKKKGGWASACTVTHLGMANCVICSPSVENSYSLYTHFETSLKE